MPEAVGNMQFVFRGKTVDELRKELNRFAEQMQRELKVDSIVVKQVVFVPIEGPHRRVDARMLSLFARLEQYNDPARAEAVLHVVSPNASLGKALEVFTMATCTHDSRPGGLSD